VKGLVELHGGAVEARSGGPGTGAELVVTLPLAAAPAAERAPAVAAAAAPLRILIVEDNRDAAQSLRDLLEVSGHEVRVAHAADDGLAAARRARADVVICDVGLPGRSGYDVALALRADPATRDVVLVAVTGYATPDDRRRAIESGFDHHFGKPVDPVRLGEVLREVARRVADGTPAAAG
jgi:CheY-like chemotaxis protein